MVHAALHFPVNLADEICLWAFAVQHAVWLYNQLPNPQTGLTQLEIFTEMKTDHCNLRWAHVWGCPTFILEPKLQDGKKIPKWNRWARMWQFLGFSEEHSFLVPHVCSLATNYVLSQFHVIFDSCFKLSSMGLCLKIAMLTPCMINFLIHVKTGVVKLKWIQMVSSSINLHHWRICG